MTSRERLLTAIRGGTPDRVPVGPWGLGRLDPDGPLAAELLCRTDPLIDVWAGDPFLGTAVRVESRQVGSDTVTVIHTPDGPLTQRYRRTHATGAVVEFFLKTPQDAERLLSLPYEPPEPDLSQFHWWRERAGDDALILAGLGTAVCLPASWFSPEGFCLAWADAPELVEHLAAIASERLNAYVDRLCAAGVDAVRLYGGEYVTVQLGPAAFEQLVQPFDAELIRIVHRHGGVVCYHNHGPVSVWLERLADLGMDALDPLEAPPWGDCDLRDAKRRIGHRVCLIGNLDDMEVLDKLPTEEVRALGRACIEAAGPGGYILGGTTSGTFGERGARAFIALAEVAEAMA